jgi:hypothetical protein
MVVGRADVNLTPRAPPIIGPEKRSCLQASPGIDRTIVAGCFVTPLFAHARDSLRALDCKTLVRG